MKHYLFYLIKYMAIIVKPLLGHDAYMELLTFALKQRGIIFTGKPRYIAPDVHIDTEGGLSIGNNFVASTRVIILTHDYSFTMGLEALGKRPPTDIEICLPVKIGNNVFVGAGAIILPGTHIGNHVIIGAGSIVQGMVEDNSVYAGNPAKHLFNISEWTERKISQTNPAAFFKDRK